MILETSVFESIVNYITSVAKIIGFNWIAVIAFVLLLLTIVISFACTMFSIDAKTSKAVQQINLYLEKNPYVNEENLVEFNKLMKRIPAPMRTQWQQYMVGRNKKPSEYFTEENCIDKPFKSSSYASHILAVKVMTVCIAILAFVFSAGVLVDSAAIGQAFLKSGLISGMVAILGAMYVLFLKSRRSALLYDLYYNFTNLKNYLDRAVSTLPDYVDYEILFTRKEIAAGIPVLQEYLKQRAEYEQQQIEHAKASQVEHEQYDFSQLGVDAAIIMEKAMRECEYMLGNKKRIMSEISELQSNLESYERTYDEKLKGTQRKLRDIQESLDRLKEKLQTTTNMIVGNDLRKQRENEIEKQRQIEKESQEDTRKFEESKKKILEQIDAKKAEIEEFRKNAEAVLTDEFKAYSNKIYAELKNIADEQVKDELDTAHQDINNLQQALEEKDKVLVERTAILNEKQDIESYASEIQTSYEELSNAYDAAVKELEEKDKLLAQYGYEAEQKQAKEEPEPVEDPIPQNDQYNGLSSFFAGSELTEEELYNEPQQEEQPAEEPVVEEAPAEEQPVEPVEEVQPEQPAEEPNVEEKPKKKKDLNADALARENEILSKQLENTQEILKTIVSKDDKKKKPAKKKSTKKADAKKKEKAKPKAEAKSKKPVKKASTKAEGDKKLKAKRKTANSKYADKPWSERQQAEEKPKKPRAPRKKKQTDNGANGDDGNLADLSLEQFNEQLKNAISDIASNQGDDNK